jgi:hypothetical protein
LTVNKLVPGAFGKQNCLCEQTGETHNQRFHFFRVLLTSSKACQKPSNLLGAAYKFKACQSHPIS